MNKYTNIEQEFPRLPHVLIEAIQQEVLEIKVVDCSCEKFLSACGVYPELEAASHVVYSPFIKRAEHPYETFVFINAFGDIVCHINGSEMELYGLLKPCMNLALSQEYVNSHTGQKVQRRSS